MIRSAIFFFCLMFCSAISLASGQVSKSEKAALVDLYNSTNGKEWNAPWDLDAPVDTWKGVEVKDGKVVGLTLFMNNLNLFYQGIM